MNQSVLGLYFEEFEDKKDALRREREFKKYSHLEKENIIKQFKNVYKNKYKI